MLGIMGMGSLVGRGPALRTLTGLVRRGIVDHGDVEELLSLYVRVFGGRGIVVGQHFGFHPWNALVDIDPSWVEFHTAHRHLDPSAAYLEEAPAGTGFIASRHFRAGTRDDLLYDGFVAHDFEDALIQRFLTPWQEEIFFVTYRRRRMGIFSREDATLAYLLYPHVGGALATRTALHAIAEGTGASPAPQGHASIGFPDLDVELSPGARRLFARALDVSGGRGWDRVARLLQRAALAFHRGAPGSRSRILVPGVRAEHAWIPPRRGETHRALALLFREAPERVRLSAPVAAVLSPMQREVAALAASGATNREIAAALGIGPETVRTHLREVFTRLGVSRRTELAALIAAPDVGG